MKFEEWLKLFKAEFEKRAGYALTMDDLFAERLREDCYDEEISPEDAVTEEMSAEL